MISIKITEEAYEALTGARMPRINQIPTPSVHMRIWVDRKFVDRLLALRDRGESYSDIILRLARAS
jgi:hypothetical protein